MMLDAPSFNLVLTPEAALSIVQKEVQKKGWKKVEVEEIRLVYTPYWVFSFDVLAEGSQPSGRAAINANTGDLDEIVPMLLERPFEKTKKTDDKAKDAEVEGTSISRPEAERVAPAKVAAMVGLKKDSVAVSALSKYYIPAYRIWVVVPPEQGDTYKISVDALLGAPQGLEGVPVKGAKPGWGDDTEITLEKMKSPQGWAQLVGATMNSILSGSIFSSRPAVLALLALVAIALAIFVFGQTAVKVECRPSADLVEASPFLSLSNEQLVAPKLNRAGQLYVNGVCDFKNTGKEAVPVCAKVILRQDGKDSAHFNSTCIGNLQPSETPSQKEFTITWRAATQSKYSLRFERFV